MKSRDRRNYKSCGATQVDTERIRLCLVLSYKSALITGADHPLTATHQTAFGHPQKSIHKLPEYRLSANGDSLQDE